MLNRIKRLSIKFSLPNIPSVCQLCQLSLKNGEYLCEFCQRVLPWNHGACQRCAIPLTVISQSQICGVCLNQPWSFDRCIAPLKYDDEIRLMVTTLKFHQQLSNAKVLGHLFSQKIHDYYTDCFPEAMIPIPLYPSRIRKRGFNQALEICKAIRSMTKIPIIHKCCQRIKSTKPQSALKVRDRKINLQNAFAVHKTINFTHVAIVDDVFTTGNTVEALAATLKKQGIKKIDVWCIARAY